jgi:hypothetical protein
MSPSGQPVSRSSVEAKMSETSVRGWCLQSDELIVSASCCGQESIPAFPMEKAAVVGFGSRAGLVTLVLAGTPQLLFQA